MPHSGSFIPQTFMEPVLCGRPCVSSGDTRRSRTPQHLEWWSKSCSHMRKVERHPLVPQKRATRGRVQEEHLIVGAWVRGFGALGNWVHSARGDGNEPGWWQHPELYTVSYEWEENLKWDIHIRRSSSVLDKFPGAGRKLHYDQEQWETCLCCLI